LQKETARGRAPGAAEISRREALQLVAGAIAISGSGTSVTAATAQDGPCPGDRLVLADADDGVVVPLRIEDIKAASNAVIAYPYDVATKTIRSDSRLNKVLLVYVDPQTLDAETKQRSAGGVLAYSAICTHQGCVISEWKADERSFLCFCHFSKFAPLEDGKVLAGPAPSNLPYLSVTAEDGVLIATSPFSATPGPRRPS